jgi:hypothetical protein
MAVSGRLEASALAKPCGPFEGVIDRAAVEALVAQLASDSPVQHQQGGLPFAVGDGGGIQPLRRRFRPVGGTEGPARGRVQTVVRGCTALSCGNKPSGEKSTLVGLSNKPIMVISD